MMVTRWPALETVPAWPVAVPTVAVGTDADRHGALLDELDTLITDYETALAARDTAARRVSILDLRIAAARAALAVSG